MSLTFVDLFAGMGGFYEALTSFGYRCVFASEIDRELRELYIENFPDMKNCTYGDIRDCKDDVPDHDILCAGFPCQPFSKSGSQKGIRDQTRGTLFDDILYVLERRQPEHVILENVGNFERHDKGNTWRVVKKALQELGYHVRGTEHVKSGGEGLLSPHQLGFPQIRGRFFIVCSRSELPENPFPSIKHESEQISLHDIVQSQNDMSDRDRTDADLQPHRIECIEHWNELMVAFPDPDVTLPSFPIWSDEFGATYPFMETTPYHCDEPTLRAYLNGKAEDPTLTHKDLLNLLPSYARKEEFPRWKQRYIQQNREWFEQHRHRIPEHWLNKLRTFCSSHRKLEWNCQGAERDLWQHILQFRPSGIRVRRFDRSPALVAMTAVQVPILGPYRRFMTRTEGLRLQGFPDEHKLPLSREAAFRALGNTVHVEVVKAIVKSFLQPSSPETEAQMQIGTDITLGSPINAPSLVTNSGANHGNGTYTHSEECQHTT